ncbi:MULTISPECIES: hypothetical protein [Dermacoccus]|nr:MULTISPECIES: hypothetical protein [Dermacoccus]
MNAHPTRTVATCLVALASLTACGGGSGAGDKASSSSSSPAVKVSFAEAIKSEQAATEACRALVGDGMKQARWLTHVSTDGGTKVDGTIGQATRGPSFTCTVTDKKGEFAGDGFTVVTGRENFDYEARQDIESASEPDRAASAWNERAGLGVLADAVRTGKNQAAVRDLQSVIDQVGK